MNSPREVRQAAGRRSRPVAAALVLAGLSLVGAAAPPPARGGSEMEALIRHVEENERLYEDADVRVETEYRAFHEPGNSPDFREITWRHESVRFRSKGDLFRVEVSSRSRSGEEGLPDREWVRAFDGRVTRSVQDDDVVNIRDGRSPDGRTVRPHMFFWSPGRKVRLSAYLRGNRAILEDNPDEQIGPGRSIVGTHQGVVTFEGRRCHKVWITSGRKDGAGFDHRYELWLSEDRNYLPVRRFAYKARDSETTPVGEGSVTELREVRPGVWYPAAAEVTAYDKDRVRRDGAQVPIWRKDLKLVEVSLEPALDESVFRDVEIPVGAAVYHLDREGEIIRSYRQGDPDAPQ